MILFMRQLRKLTMAVGKFYTTPNAKVMCTATCVVGGQQMFQVQDVEDEWDFWLVDSEGVYADPEDGEVVEELCIYREVAAA